jgi:hypothetical protein
MSKESSPLGFCLSRINLVVVPVWVRGDIGHNHIGPGQKARFSSLGIQHARAVVAGKWYSRSRCGSGPKLLYSDAVSGVDSQRGGRMG